MRSARSPFPVIETIAAFLVVAGYAELSYLQLKEQLSAVPRFDTQSTFDAAPGGYGALYEVLKREGVRVEQFARRAAFLDHAIDVFVVSDNGFDTFGSALQPADIDALASWVKSGGTLIAVGGDYRSDQSLKMASIDDKGSEDDRARPVIATALTAGVSTIEGTSPDRIPFSGSTRQTPIMADKSGLVVATYSLGKGTVVVVTDRTLFQNRNLARAGNARLAYDLVTADRGRRTVVAFEEYSHGHQVDSSIWSILPDAARVALVIVSLAIFALLVSTFFRFGPVVRPPVDHERTSAEYLSSMAALMARGGATRKALRDVADAAIRGLAGTLGFQDNAPVALLAARLRARVGGSELADALLELNRLRSYEYPKEADLLAAARIAAILRKEHAPNARIGFGRRRAPSKRTA